MQYDHKKKYFTYCDNHTHQLKTTITYTKKIKTITFIGPVHHTHRNIFNINFYRVSTTHTHIETFPTKTFIGPVHHTHTEKSQQKLFWASTASTSHTHTEKFSTKTSLGQYITHTETFPRKTFIGPVHHTHREKFPTKTFLGQYSQYITYTHREISNKNFFGPVHHTHSNISNKNFYRVSTSQTQILAVRSLNNCRESRYYTVNTYIPCTLQ